MTASIEPVDLSPRLALLRGAASSAGVVGGPPVFAQAAKKLSGVTLYGIPWTAEAMLGGASRFDLVKRAGLAYPDTTDDLVAVLEAVHRQDRVAGFVADNHYGWTFPPYLHAFGGDVFRKPPDDLHPTLDTPEAIAAAEYFARLLREFGPDGAVSYTADQVLGKRPGSSSPGPRPSRPCAGPSRQATARRRAARTSTRPSFATDSGSARLANAMRHAQPCAVREPAL